MYVYIKDVHWTLWPIFADIGLIWPKFQNYQNQYFLHESNQWGLAIWKY